MKLLSGPLMLFALAIPAQQNPAVQLKHVSVPTATSLRPIAVTADEIQRELPYPSVMHLKGNVEISTPVCVRPSPGKEFSCDGSVVVRANEADLHEDTGQIEARGDVKVTRELSVRPGR